MSALRPRTDRVCWAAVAFLLLAVASLLLVALAPSSSSTGKHLVVIVTDRPLPQTSTSPGNTSNGSGPPQLSYSVTFLAQGIPPGLRWGVRFGEAATYSTSSSLTFNAQPAGTYSYTILPPDGYQDATPSGNLDVNQAARVAVNFTPVPTSPTLAFGSWPPSALELELIGVIVLLGGGAILINEVVARRRKHRAPGEGSSPPATDPVERDP